LVLEERGGKVPEFGRGQALDGEACFVDEGGGWVPGLDLLAEDELEVGSEGGGGADVGDGGGGEGFDDFCLGWGRGWLVGYYLLDFSLLGVEGRLWVRGAAGWEKGEDVLAEKGQT
jgi:hypothetical protein